MSNRAIEQQTRNKIEDLLGNRFDRLKMPLLRATGAGIVRGSSQIEFRNGIYYLQKNASMASVEYVLDKMGLLDPLLYNPRSEDPLKRPIDTNQDTPYRSFQEWYNDYHLTMGSRSAMISDFPLVTLENAETRQPLLMGIGIPDLKKPYQRPEDLHVWLRMAKNTPALCLPI